MYREVSIKDRLPDKEGKYIVITKTLLGGNKFQTSFSGKSFDASGQIVTHWLEEISLLKIFKEWCSLTKRSGGVLVGSSIKEMLNYIEKQEK